MTAFDWVAVDRIVAGDTPYAQAHDDDYREAVRRLAAAGLGPATIAGRTGTSHNVVARYLRQLGLREERAS